MWIELHDSARGHPKIIKLARDLGMPRCHALGHLCSLWLWTLRMAPDGNLESFDVDDIEIGAEWGGEPGAFVAACVARGLLEESDGSLTVHDWVDFSGSLKAATRMRESRERKRIRQLEEEKERLRNSAERLRHVTQTERPNDQTERPDQVAQDQISGVWSHWLEKRPTVRRKELKSTHPEYRLIKKRLRDYAAEDLCRAIDGMFLDRWSVDNAKLEIGWALRDDEKNANIERFIGYATNGPPSRGSGNGRPKETSVDDLPEYLRREL